MRFTIKTKGFTDIIDITPKIRELIKESGVKEGVCLVSCLGSTCGITTLEYEQGLIEDLKKVLNKIIPMTTDYEHCKKWGDCNGYAHVRSAFINPFLSLIVKQGEPFLGVWQQVVFIDFDNRPREREIFVKVIKGSGITNQT